MYLGRRLKVFFGSEAKAEGVKGDIRSDIAYHDRRMIESRMVSSSPFALRRGDLMVLSGVEVVEVIEQGVFRKATNVCPLWLQGQFNFRGSEHQTATRGQLPKRERSPKSFTRRLAPSGSLVVRQSRAVGVCRDGSGMFSQELQSRRDVQAPAHHAFQAL